MPDFYPDELSQWVSRQWENGMPEAPFTGISHDTRTLRPGNLYVAIRGENFDGHNFVEQAFEKGASGALVHESFDWQDNPVLRVPDTVKGLHGMARGYRREWESTVIGITGSVGKTTVKEMCADVLSMKGETHRTAGNFNNHIFIFNHQNCSASRSCFNCGRFGGVCRHLESRHIYPGLVPFPNSESTQIRPS